mmetsp:Transcript_38488/g.99458  ORF Transcript_38488/g.99458 Transcript_38488/m.99458 type:complete len:267 (-) Transcript_38488:620-1420(-)
MLIDTLRIAVGVLQHPLRIAVGVLQHLLRKHALHHGVDQLHLLGVHDCLFEHRDRRDSLLRGHMVATLLADIGEPTSLNRRGAAHHWLLINLMPVGNHVAQAVRQTGRLERDLDLIVSTGRLHPHPHCDIRTLIIIKWHGPLLEVLHIGCRRRGHHAIAEHPWQVAHLLDDALHIVALGREYLRIQVDVHLAEVHLTLQHRNGGVPIAAEGALVKLLQGMLCHDSCGGLGFGYLAHLFVQQSVNRHANQGSQHDQEEGSQHGRRPE